MLQTNKYNSYLKRNLCCMLCICKYNLKLQFILIKNYCFFFLIIYLRNIIKCSKSKANNWWQQTKFNCSKLSIYANLKNKKKVTRTQNFFLSKIKNVYLKNNKCLEILNNITFREPNIFAYFWLLYTFVIPPQTHSYITVIIYTYALYTHAQTQATVSLCVCVVWIFFFLLINLVMLAQVIYEL